MDELHMIFIINLSRAKFVIVGFFKQQGFLDKGFLEVT
jgi:hypothetical protein